MYYEYLNIINRIGYRYYLYYLLDRHLVYGMILVQTRMYASVCVRV